MQPFEFLLGFAVVAWVLNRLPVRVSIKNLQPGIPRLFRRLESWRLSHLLFIGHRTQVVQSRVATLTVVKTLDVLKDDEPGLLPGLELVTIHTFAFERAEETLHGCIIVTVARAT